MAVTNHERVGKSLELLMAGLAPFVEREFRDAYQGAALDEAERYVVNDRLVVGRPFEEWDAAVLLKLMWEAWNVAPKRFHGSVRLDPLRTGSEAGRVSDEVLSHLAGLVGAGVTVTLEIEATIPQGAPEHVVRTVTENARSLRFDDAGFEQE